MRKAGASAFVSKEEASERLYETIMALTSTGRIEESFDI
jgi:hypothetical protein